MQMSRKVTAGLLVYFNVGFCKNKFLQCLCVRSKLLKININGPEYKQQ